MKFKLKFAAFFAFIFCFGAFFISKVNTQNKFETAGQKFKSIKVLNEMPADQMGKVMNMMSASLGVDCKYCHASNDGDYEKEGFEHKDAARQMLKMTFELNKNYFEGRPEINCNTCHQGKAQPKSSIPLIPNLAKNPPIDSSKNPTVQEILNKYENALGGEKNLKKITSRLIKARRIEPDGKTFEEEEILQKGKKLSITTVYPSEQYGDYVIKEIFDGENAFKLGNGENIELKADEIEQIKREAQIFANPNLSDVYQKIEFVSVENIEARKVYRLNAFTSKNFREILYFDAISGLLIRRVATTPTVLGAFQFQVDYTNYKDFGGVKLPVVVKFAVPNIYWERKILSVKNNAQIDDRNFIK